MINEGEHPTPQFGSVLRTLTDGAALPSATITKLRETMQVFLRANAKCPDYRHPF